MSEETKNFEEGQDALKNANVTPEQFDWDSFESGLNAEDRKEKSELEKMYDTSLRELDENQVFKGKVVRITDKEAIVDINFKSEGVISLNEFRYNPNLAVGDEVEVMVAQREDKTGQLQLSHRKARMLKACGDKYIEDIQIPFENYRIGIGPGLGTEVLTKMAFEKLLEKENNPMVLDADALNIISENNDLLKLVPKNSIITPHPKEFERLFGKTSSSIEQCELARKKAKEYEIVIVIKGHNTAILLPDGLCYYNATGNAGMAKGGSGDVLTGIITGLLAQGYDSKLSAILGVYIHGKAGDYASEKFSQEAMTAQSIVQCLSDVFLKLKK